MSAIQTVLSYCLGNKNDKCSGNTNQLAVERERRDMETAKQVSDRSITDYSWQMAYNLSTSNSNQISCRMTTPRCKGWASLPQSDEQMLSLLKWVIWCKQTCAEMYLSGWLQKFQLRIHHLCVRCNSLQWLIMLSQHPNVVTMWLHSAITGAQIYAYMYTAVLHTSRNVQL